MERVAVYWANFFISLTKIILWTILTYSGERHKNSKIILAHIFHIEWPVIMLGNSSVN